ncbi:MAG: ATP-grasp domain-containing protein [Clostridia bacterium]|nr:ATP-grasp domain-containing protein [Clostridia bacterium]
MKKLLIIGAGEFQLPGIIEAKKQGYYVIATDGNPNALGKDYADEFYHLDVRDLEANYKLAKEKEISGVVAVSSEVSVETVAYVSEKLNLVGNKFEVAVLCHNKEAYYKAFSKNGINVPSTFCYGDNVEEIKTEYVIIKPGKGSGSRLVHKVRKEDIDAHVAIYRNEFNADESILIQEYVKGKEITVDGFVYNDSVSVVAISHEKCDPEISNSVSYELDFPPRWINTEIYDRIADISSKSAKAAGIEFGPFHMELIINDQQELYLIDFALRGGGFKLFTDIIEKTSGVNALQEYIRGAMGEEIQIKQPEIFDPVIMRFLYADKKGILQEIGGSSLEGVYSDYMLGFLKSVGDVVDRPSSGRDRLAYIICWGTEMDKVTDRMETITSSIKFTIE